MFMNIRNKSDMHCTCTNIYIHNNSGNHLLTSLFKIKGWIDIQNVMAIT